MGFFIVKLDCMSNHATYFQGASPQSMELRHLLRRNNLPKLHLLCPFFEGRFSASFWVHQEPRHLSYQGTFKGSFLDVLQIWFHAFQLACNHLSIDLTLEFLVFWISYPASRAHKFQEIKVFICKVQPLYNQQQTYLWHNCSCGTSVPSQEPYTTW